jgi:hypothetical protein
MEAVSTCETSLASTRLHDSISQMAVVFNKRLIFSKRIFNVYITLMHFAVHSQCLEIASSEARCFATWQAEFHKSNLCELNLLHLFFNF